jgi:hypothetical protein
MSWVPRRARVTPLMSISFAELFHEPSGPLPGKAEALTKAEVENVNALPFIGEGQEVMRQLLFKLLTGQFLPKSTAFLNQVKAKVTVFSHLAWACIKLAKGGAPFRLYSSSASRRARIPFHGALSSTLSYESCIMSSDSSNRQRRTPYRMTSSPR